MQYPVIEIKDKYLLIVDKEAPIIKGITRVYNEVVPWSLGGFCTYDLSLENHTVNEVKVFDGIHALLAHLPLNGNPVLEGVPLLPAINEEYEQDYTDSYDMNGTKIYEGDKVEVIENNNQFHKNNIGIVTWGKGNYFVEGTWCKYNVYAWRDSIKVLESKRLYKANQKKFTEEDVRRAISMAREYSEPLPEEGEICNVYESLFAKKYTPDEIIKSLSSSPIPTGFKAEMIPAIPLSSRGCKLSDSECYCDASESSWCEERRDIPEKVKTVNNTWIGEWIYKF